MNPFNLFMLSVVIVSYNNANIISGCLESLSSDIGELRSQIIIIDNNSADSTVREIKRFSESNKNDNIKFEIIKNSKNEGFTKALNQGLSKIKNKYVVILNPDIIIIEGFFEKIFSFFEENPGVEVVAPQHTNQNGQVIPSCRNFPDYKTLLYEYFLLSYMFKKNERFNSWKMGYFDHKSQRQVKQPMGACLFTTKKLLDEIGLFDERFKMFFSDVDWCHRVTNAGYKIVFFPKAKIIHFAGHSIHQDRYRMIIQSHRDFYSYYTKYFNNKLINFLFWLLLKITIPVRFVIVFIRKILK